MKTSDILLSLSLILILGGCIKDYQISPSQLTDVNEMKNDYQVAKIYNDSLIMCFTDSVTHPDLMKQYYDSIYHHFDSLFTQCHINYEHNDASADHSHNGQGMASMHSSHGGNMMMNNGECQCCDNGGHSDDMHNQIETLQQLHIPYHPK
jgi:hypothetical protein